MRKAQLHEFVATVLREELTGGDVDVRDAILGDERDAFARLCWRLNEESDGSPESVRGVLRSVLADLEDSTRDWLVDSADSPASFLYSRV